MRSLLAAGVVDEIRMPVCPASRGRGTRIFEDRRDLELVEATGFANGLVLLRYAVKGQAELSDRGRAVRSRDEAVSIRVHRSDGRPR